MRIASGSILGVLLLWGLIGSSYVIVSAAKWVITCVSGKGPLYGAKFCTNYYLVLQVL